MVRLIPLALSAFSTRDVLHNTLITKLRKKPSESDSSFEPTNLYPENRKKPSAPVTSFANSFHFLSCSVEEQLIKERGRKRKAKNGLEKP